MSDRKVIDDLMWELNNHVQDINTEDGDCFIYENSGYWSCIKFNDEILWRDDEDSDRWLETEDGKEIETALGDYVKLKFNQYVKRIKKYKFKIDGKESTREV